MSWSRTVSVLLLGAVLGALASGGLSLMPSEPWGLWAVHPGPDGPCLHALRPAACVCDCDDTSTDAPLIGSL